MRERQPTSRNAETSAGRADESSTCGQETRSSREDGGKAASHATKRSVGPTPQGCHGFLLQLLTSSAQSSRTPSACKHGSKAFLLYFLHGIAEKRSRSNVHIPATCAARIDKDSVRERFMHPHMLVLHVSGQTTGFPTLGCVCVYTTHPVNLIRPAR